MPPTRQAHRSARDQLLRDELTWQRKPVEQTARSRETVDVSPIAYGFSRKRVKPLTQNAALQYFFNQA